MTLSISSAVFATSTLNLACQDRYLASVKQIKNIQTNTSYPKLEIEFDVLKTLKGEQTQSKIIQVIQDGPDKFVVGTTYLLETNDNWLCSIKTVETKA